MSYARKLQIMKAHMNAAKSYADLSYARRLKVGSVIVRDDRIISIGFNGTPSGRDNNCETLLRPETGIRYSLKKISEDDIKSELRMGAELESKPEVCHAEMNAIMFAAKNGVSTNGCSLYVTHSPCFECAKMIVQCGIKEVFYEVKYRDESSIKFLQECGLLVKEMN